MSRLGCSTEESKSLLGTAKNGEMLMNGGLISLSEAE